MKLNTQYIFSNNMVFIQSILLAKCTVSHNHSIAYVIDAAFKNITNNIHEQSTIKYDITLNIKNLIQEILDYQKEPYGSTMINKSYYIYYVKDSLGCFAVIDNCISVDELKHMYKNLEILYNQYIKDNGQVWRKISRDFCTHYIPLHALLDKPVKPIDMLEKTVEETKEAVKQTLVSILDRGEKLSEISNRSDTLLINSKEFYKHSRKINRTICNKYLVLLVIIIMYCIYQIKLILFA